MSYSGSSAQRKLARGVEHVRTLQTEAEAFVDDGAYTFDTKYERRSAEELFCRCFSIQHTSPPDHWPLLAGEAIQNLRSALDHAIWTAWRSVDENTGDGDHTQFVICDSATDFKDARWHLKGVPESVWTIVEAAQPYKRWPDAPSLHPLSILRVFSNADKHRALAVLPTVIDFEMVGVGTDVELKDWVIATGKRLPEGTTEISSFLAHRTTGGEINEMDVHPSFTYRVGIEYLRLETLRGIVSSVFSTLTEIETGEPPSPFAKYPL